MLSDDAARPAAAEDVDVDVAELVLVGVSFGVVLLLSLKLL